MKHYSPFATLKIIIQVLLESTFLLCLKSPYISTMRTSCRIFLVEVGHYDLSWPHSVKVQGQSWASQLCGSVGVFSGGWWLLGTSTSSFWVGLRLRFQSELPIAPTYYSLRCGLVAKHVEWIPFRWRWLSWWYPGAPHGCFSSGGNFSPWGHSGAALK